MSTEHERAVLRADLLARLFDVPDWHADAACSEIGGDAWFPEKGESSAAAKRICAVCPVSDECREYALTAEVAEHGIWGGTSDRDRREPRAALGLTVYPGSGQTERETRLGLPLAYGRGDDEQVAA